MKLVEINVIRAQSLQTAIRSPYHISAPEMIWGNFRSEEDSFTTPSDGIRHGGFCSVGFGRVYEERTGQTVTNLHQKLTGNGPWAQAGWRYRPEGNLIIQLRYHLCHFRRQWQSINLLSGVVTMSGERASRYD